jgi:hypothetical protein
MPTLNVKAYRYVFPVKATVTVVDNNFWAKGDINRDGVIDEKDNDLLRAAFGSKPGDPNWNPDADLNGDGAINVRDAVILGGNIGSTAPEYVTPFTTEVAVGKCVLYGRYKAQKLKAVVEMTEANTKKVTFIFMTLFGKPIIR